MRGHSRCNLPGPAETICIFAFLVTVLSKTQFDTLLKAKWEGMKGALMGGDTEVALSYFVYGRRDSYRGMFNQFGLALDTAEGIQNRLL